MAEAPTRALLRAVGARRRRQLALLSLLALANAAADLLLVVASMAFLAALAGSGGPHVLLGIDLPLHVRGAALLFAVAALAANGLRIANLRLGEGYIARVAHELTVEVQRRVLRQPYSYHVLHHSSELIASLDKVQILVFSLIQAWLQGLGALVTGVGVLLVLARIEPVPAVAGFVTIGLLYLAMARLASRRLAANAQIVGHAYEARIRKVQDGLGAIRDLIIDHGEHAHLEEFRRADARFAAAHASTQTIAGAPRFIIEIAAISLACLLAARFASSGDALVLIGGIAVGGLRVLPLFQSAYRAWAELAANRAAAEGVVRLLQLPRSSDGEAAAEPLPFRRSIKIDSVDFHYAGRSQPVLRSIQLEIRKGERVALVGETGSGKSTFADLVMGLLAASGGTIDIDGIPLTQDNVRAWQRNIAHVSQTVFLADDSIAANIAFSRPGEPVDVERLKSCAAAAELAEFVADLPQGLDTLVGERGARLSGGQRQRIAIARALYKDAPLLVLDEATNSLDEATEAKLLANIFADSRRTILIIAHRTSALSGCDRIIRLASGTAHEDQATLSQ